MSPPFLKGGLFGVLAWRGEKGQKTFLEGRKKVGDILFYYFGFFDPEIEICKINYCENKAKLNNKDNIKIMLMKSSKSFTLSISFSFSLKF